MVKLIIFTMNYKNPYTGGIRFTNSFADYAKNNYSNTTIIDFAQLPWLVRRFRIITIIYFYHFMLCHHKSHIVVDHALHFRFFLPLLLSRSRYTVLFHLRFYTIKTNHFIRIASYLTEKIFLTKAAQVIVTSQSAKNDVLRFGVRKEVIRVVYPTVWSRGDGSIKAVFQGNLLFLANVEPRKGLDILIQALSLIKDIPFQLDVVGRYDVNVKYFNQVQKLICQFNLGPNIQFHGQKTGSDLRELFKKGDIFVFPSRHETFGIVLLEAMSYGLPIVATAIPSTIELIQDNKNGILCPVDDPRLLADALRLVLTDAELRKKISETNLERSKSFLSEAEVAAQVFNLIKINLN